jgi:hypothetical protein
MLLLPAIASRGSRNSVTAAPGLIDRTSDPV